MFARNCRNGIYNTLCEAEGEPEARDSFTLTKGREYSAGTGMCSPSCTREGGEGGRGQRYGGERSQNSAVRLRCTRNERCRQTKTKTALVPRKGPVGLGLRVAQIDPAWDAVPRLARRKILDVRVLEDAAEVITSSTGGSSSTTRSGRNRYRSCAEVSR